MDNIFEFIKYALSRDLFKDIMDEAENVHRRIVAAIVWLVGFFFVALLFNFLGMQKINLVLGVLINIMLATVITMPRLIFGAVIVDRVMNKQEGIKANIGNWFIFISHFMLWYSLLFLIAGTVWLGNSIGGLMAFCLAIIVLTYMQIAWQMPVAAIRKIARLYSYGVIVIAIMSLVPEAFWMKNLGFYPTAWLFPSETEQMAYKIKGQWEESENKKERERLEKISKKIKAGQDLSAEEKNCLDTYKSNAEKTKNWMSNKFKSSNPPTQTRYDRPVVGKVLEINLDPGLIYQVDQVKEGKKWKYLSMTSPFFQRVNKGDGKACWKQINGTAETWHADWSGIIEIKSGGKNTVKINIL